MKSMEHNSAEPLGLILWAATVLNAAVTEHPISVSLGIAVSVLAGIHYITQIYYSYKKHKKDNP